MIDFAHVFSVPQLVGYVAFVLGVACFLQKNDLRFKVLLAAETACYVLHFWLLGNYAAVAGAGVATLRTVVSIRLRSRRVALFFIVLTLVLGGWLVESWAGVLPILACCVGTAAVLLFHGITMRLLMLLASFMWLANNILSGSIGGTALEACIALSNTYTIWQLWRRPAQLEQATS
ncbi:MAG TPA: YgjV family protein [Rhodocyclaceae bacterium]|nr:YgjV family protein [Rhodocyclaceae bacterium]